MLLGSLEAVVGREGATLHSCLLEDDLLPSENFSEARMLISNLSTTSSENGRDHFGDVDVRDPFLSMGDISDASTPVYCVLESEMIWEVKWGRQEGPSTCLEYKLRSIRDIQDQPCWLPNADVLQLKDNNNQAHE